MMFPDDLISTVSTDFTELDDDGNDDGEAEPPEEKYEPPVPVKTEIEELIPPDVPLTEDDIDDHFLNSFSAEGGEPMTCYGGDEVVVGREEVVGGEEEGEEAEKRKRFRRKKDPDDDKDDRDWNTWKPKKRKPLPPGTARRGGRRKQMTRQERQAYNARKRREMLPPEEKEKLRETWKVQKQKSRKVLKHRHDEEEGLRALVEDDDDHNDDIDNVNEVEPTEDNEDGSPRRPARRAKLKALIKEEPLSSEENEDVGDEDYQLDPDDDDWKRPKKKTARKSTGGRPRKSRTTSTGGRGRKKKAEGEEKPKKKRAKRQTSKDSEDSSRRSRSSGGVKRKKIGEMTPEEREAIKAKWREEARLKRARQRETMTPEQREEYLRTQRERRREQRALAKVTMTEEEREEENRKARERKKAKRALMTPEQRKEEAQKVTMRRIERLATMTEDEKKMWRMNNYLQNMARMSRMTPEEIEKRRQQRLDYAKRRREQMTADDLERRRLRIKAYRDSMTPERRAKFLEKLRDGYRRRLERLRDDPSKWNEVKEKWKEDRLRRQAKMKEMGSNYVRREKAPNATSRRRYTRKHDPNETPEQRAERIRMSRRKTQKKIKLKKKLAMQKLLESGMSMDEIQQKIETPAQRERRLMRHRINRAKWNLRKRLESVGAPPEEIEQKLTELQQTYQPTFNFRPYKPRPEAWKPIDPTDLALLEEPVDKKPEIESPAPRPSTSKARTPSTPARRGRPPKNIYAPATDPPPPPVVEQKVEIIQEITIPPPQTFQPNTTVIISRAGAATQIQFQPTTVQMVYPQQVSSPAGASTCSYVSAAETPEPVHYHHQMPQQHHQIIHQQYTPHQQQQLHVSQQYNQPQQYHFQTPVVYPHQQPQAPPQTYSLQHILDSITFQEAPGTGGAGPTIIAVSNPAANFQLPPPPPVHLQQDTSSHQDYASSYDNPSPPPSSPPASPGAQSNYSGVTFGDIPFNPDQQVDTELSAEASRKRGRPRKDEPPRPKKPKGSARGHRPGPRGPKKSNKTNVIRDMVCDECGNAYNHAYLREHKNQFHNPNYKNQTCQICGDKFNVARHWYTHYIRTHVQPTLEVKERPHMCDVCGQSFRQKNNLEKHKYYMHGDGLKKENFKKCPVCPGEKLFKETVSLYAHLRRKHPNYNRGGHDCYRCDQTFPDEKELSVHVKNDHGDSYFPCQYCNACRFTKYGLNFHYFRCTKISKEDRDKIRKTEEGMSLDRVPLPCEFCKRNVAVFSLTRHYWEMHNVKEEGFTCPDCGKNFRVREFWVVHMEEKHLRTLDQMKDLVRSLNVSNREGLVIKNPDGLKGGVPGNTPSKAAAQKRIEMGTAKKGGRSKGQRAKKGKKGRGVWAVTAEEEDVEETSMDMSEDGGKREVKTKRRQVIVIAEEEENGMVDPYVDDETGYKPKKRRGRKPGPKSKTRRRRESSEEEEEEEVDWRESEDEDEEDQEYTPRPGRRTSTRSRGRPKRFVEEEKDDGDSRDPDYPNDRDEEDSRSREADYREGEDSRDPDYQNESDDDRPVEFLIEYRDDVGRPATPIDEVDEEELLEAIVKQEVLSDEEEEAGDLPSQPEPEEEGEKEVQQTEEEPLIGEEELPIREEEPASREEEPPSREEVPPIRQEELQIREEEIQQ